MTSLDSTIVFGLAVANVLAFTLMGVDKWRARRRGPRIPEAALLTLCACFGGLGSWLGMQVFRHKTSKRRFVFTVPVMMLLQIALVTLYFRYGR